MSTRREGLRSPAGQIPVCHFEYRCLSIALDLPADCGFFTPRKISARSTIHSCSKTCGGSHTRILPITCTEVGPVQNSIRPPCRPSIRAFVRYHSPSSSGSVIASQTISGGCDNRRSNSRVVNSPSTITPPKRDEEVLVIIFSSYSRA